MTKIITFHKKAALYQLSGEENIKKCLVYKTYNPSVGGSNPVSIKKPLAIPVVITSSTRGGRKHFLNENYRETCLTKTIAKLALGIGIFSGDSVFVFIQGGTYNLLSVKVFTIEK